MKMGKIIILGKLNCTILVRYGQIVGRMKDMIIRGGENIYPREIEDFLHTHQDIAEVQAIGVADRRLGSMQHAGYKILGFWIFR